MKNLVLAVGFFAAALVVAAACNRKNRPGRVMTFRDLYKDNDIDLRGLIDG